MNVNMPNQGGFAPFMQMKDNWLLILLVVMIFCPGLINSILGGFGDNSLILILLVVMMMSGGKLF